MDVTTWLVVVGLAVTLVGALVSAYDLRPPPWELLPHVMAAREELLTISDEARRKGFVSPPYTEQQVSDAMARADELGSQDRVALSKQQARAQQAETFARFTWARRGLVAIAVGTALQIVGAVLEAFAGTA